MKMITIAHVELSKACPHQSELGPPYSTMFICQPHMPAPTRPKLQHYFLMHFQSFIRFLERGQPVTGNQAEARAEVFSALVEFCKERYVRGICLEPLWRFLLKLILIVHDLDLAKQLNTPFKEIHALSPICHEFGVYEHEKCPIDLRELPQADKICPICLLRYSSYDEMDYWATFRMELPFHDEQEARAGEIILPEMAHRVKFGHLFGEECLQTELNASAKRGNIGVGRCPTCRCALTRHPPDAFTELLALGVAENFKYTH